MSGRFPLWKVSNKRVWLRVTTSVLKSLDCEENNLHWYTNLTTLPTFESHFKIFISFFFPIHFDYFSPTPTLLSSSSPTPYPPKVMFLSLKRKGRKRQCRVCFGWSTYSWTRGLPWSVVDWPCITLSEETGFPFPNRHRLQLVSWLGVGLLVSFPLSILGLLSSLNLCVSCASCHGFCAFLSVLLEDAVFLESATTSGS